MSNTPKFSCFLIGSESLLIACGEILLEGGNDVRGVISTEPQVVEWARSKGVRWVDPVGGYANALREAPFDYLLSITNLEILPPEIVSLPLRGAVNFHDGPLPRYGGLFAPVWALIDRQSQHGITWHLMNAEADAGEIVAQRLFDIAPGETSFSLNTKCYAQGIESFPEVVEALNGGLASKRAHVLDKETFHKRSDRPAGNCAIRFDSSAAEIVALARALDFGTYANPFGLPRLTLGHEVVLVPTIDLNEASSGLPAGTVIAVKATGITVATANGDVVLQKFVSVDGRPLEPVDVAAHHGLAAGVTIPPVDASKREAVDAAIKTVARNEPFWISRLTSAESATIPYVSTSSGAGASRSECAVSASRSTEDRRSNSRNLRCRLHHVRFDGVRSAVVRKVFVRHWIQ